MKVNVYALTTDGDNLGIETVVYATEEEARSEIIECLENEGLRRCKDGFNLSAASNEELKEIWEDTFNGCCTLEKFEIEAKEIVADDPIEAEGPTHVTRDPDGATDVYSHD